MKKPFGQTKVGKLLKGLVVDALHVTPVIGTIITVFKEDTPQNPKGIIKLAGKDYYKLAIGIIGLIVVAKGMMTAEEVESITAIIGF